MPEVNRCEARQCSDQMVCDRCDLGWDMNDPDPPECCASPVQVKKELPRHVRITQFRVDEINHTFSEDVLNKIAKELGINRRPRAVDRSKLPALPAVPEDWVSGSRVGEYWTEEEEAMLRAEVSHGLTIADIASRHRRKAGGIVQRIKYLNLDPEGRYGF